jgi:hypothetical protein
VRRKFVFLLLVIAVLGGAAWWQRVPILSWYYVRELAGATEEGREIWVRRVAGLDAAALPRLLDCLRSPEAHVCGNAEAALAALASAWGAEDGRGWHMAGDMLARFESFSSNGQASALRAVRVLFSRGSGKKGCPPSLEQAAVSLLTASAGKPELRPATLALAGALVERVLPESCRELCLDLARKGLEDDDAQARVQAINLILHLSRQVDAKLLAEVVPLLRDPENQVRRAALVAVGPSKGTVAEDELLPLLHDADPEVCRLAEAALHSRGMPESHIVLARLISDERPAARLQVVDRLVSAADLPGGVGVWLRRLSRDTEPAVRAAAVRAAYFQTQVDLRDRLEQMSKQDPSPTVRQIAAHFLGRPRMDADE